MKKEKQNMKKKDLEDVTSQSTEAGVEVKAEETVTETASVETNTDAKPAKVKKEKKSKKSKMPDWYIGRPKPMKVKRFEFHKPTVKFYVGLGIFVILAGFITIIAVKLLNV